MTKSELVKVIEAAKCKVIGADDASNDGQRKVLAALIRVFDSSESSLLCEPSLARKTDRPPDIVLIDPEIGVHVFEVKAVTLDQIEGLAAGGLLSIRYASGVQNKNPINQVRAAMFDIKDAAVRAFHGDFQLRFKYWVVFPSIRRFHWTARFGQSAYCPDEFLFADDLDSTELTRLLGASDRRFSNKPIDMCPLDQLECVWRAFGDTSVLYASPEDRPPRRSNEGTLGEHFDEAAETYKQLSEEQQRLSEMNWEGGPRLVRGVAGSGKTIVLANNLARRLERMCTSGEELFGPQQPLPRILTVCFNRTLAPYIEKKIHTAFKQRTGNSIPPNMLEVRSFNALMWQLTNAKLWQYQNVSDVNQMVRALKYLDELQQFRKRDPERVLSLAYDAIYVDEGQDFHEEEFRLLKELCRVGDGGEPNLYVFYDDAQNLYARRRPNWQSLGLNVRGGRSFVMTQCFRNTRSILEPSFNVLYGVCAEAQVEIPTKDFGDVGTLEEKGLVEKSDGFWKVTFAPSSGNKPILAFADNARHEERLLISRLKWLIEEQEVRLADILVLTFSRQRAYQLSDVISKAKLNVIKGVHIALEDKDHTLGQEGMLTISTVASAKGYDAYCVLLVSANEFAPDILGRASFYVGCTRAIEHLEIFAYEKKGLVVEMEAALARSDKSKI